MAKAAKIDREAGTGDAMRATVIYEGRVNLRREPKMEPGNIVGKASTGESFVVLDTFEEEGYKWYFLEGEKYIRADEALVTVK